MSHSETDRIIRIKELLRKIGLSKSTLYNEMAKGNFPLPAPLTGRSRGWSANEVEQWISDRKAARNL